jgi:hypothetical protein
LYYITQIFEHRKQCNSTAIIADDNQGNASAQSQLVNAFISGCGYNDTHVRDYANLLICYGNLLYAKERLAIGYSLLKRSLRFSYGQHYTEWDSPTALHVTRMNVMRKADNEHSPAMIEVMNRIKYAFGHGPLARKIQENISPITVERVRPTTDISRQERNRQIVRMSHSVYVFSDGDVMVFGGDNECHFCREYNITLLPVIPTYGSHFAGSKVSPPEDGSSQPLKATQATRGPEEELGKSREALRVIYDNHSGIATRAHEDEDWSNDENYNPRQGAKATSATKPMRQVLRYKTHESSNMAVAVRRTPFTNPRAQSVVLLVHGKTRPDHVHARAMAEERVDQESGADEIVARESFNEEGSVEDVFGNCPPCEPPSAGDAKDEAEEPRISYSDTEPSADKDSMCDREDDKDAEQEPEEIGEETVRRSVSKGFTKKPRQDHDILVSRADTTIRRFGGLEFNPETSHQSHQGKLQVSPRDPTIWPEFPRTQNAMSAATMGGRGST